MVLLILACTGREAPLTESGTAPTGTPPPPAMETATPTDTAPPPPTCLAAGVYDRTVEVAGVELRYRLTVPEGADPHPGVIVFHGGGSTGAAMETVSQLTQRGGPRGYATLFPEGFRVGGVSQVWNAGACCGPVATLPDHVAATLAMLDDAQAAGACLDDDRIFATGHSNGAMMTYRLACEASERLSAVTISAGTLATEDQTVDPPDVLFTCAPSRPVPVLHVHGLEDTCVTYDGSQAAQGSDLLAVEDAVRVFRERAACPDDPDDVTEGVVRRRRWSCPDDVEVQLVTVEDLGHAWAGSPIYGNPELCGGTTTIAVSTTDEALDFFDRY
ncbi:MAG: hypothetical protein AAF602_05685 [Myxococcota bacterium]